MNVGKIIGRAVLGALVMSVVPYQLRKDEETGAVEVRSLLWGWKKTPRAEGEEKDRYIFAIPASGLDCADETEAETPAEEAGAEAPPEA